MMEFGLDKILVTVFGIAAIVFTYWFFLLKRREEVRVTDEVTIVVDGGYTPEVISIAQGKTTTLKFLRKDPSGCLEDVILGDFKIRKHLPLNEIISIALTPQHRGEFTYSCGMNMFHGRIIVR